MNHDGPNALYQGTVTHKRLRPVKHSLRYTVFSLFVDCDDMAKVAKKLRLFSYNRFNLTSLYDRDYGDGSCLRTHLQALAQKALPDVPVTRFKMLTYPRILGYAFNPLTVYYGLDAACETRLMIYEVNNTFGQRHTYVIPAATTQEGMIRQHCDKAFYVSPFNDVSGRYRFHVTPARDTLTVGVALDDDGAPVLNAWFRGERKPLTDRQLLSALLATGWMTVKVTAGIHLEALRLWLKGMKPRPRPDAPRHAVKFVEPPTDPEQ